jgi:hypothetical protein
MSSIERVNFGWNGSAGKIAGSGGLESLIDEFFGGAPQSRAPQSRHFTPPSHEQLRAELRRKSAIGGSYDVDHLDESWDEVFVIEGPFTIEGELEEKARMHSDALACVNEFGDDADFMFNRLQMLKQQETAPCYRPHSTAERRAWLEAKALVGAE